MYGCQQEVVRCSWQRCSRTICYGCRTGSGILVFFEGVFIVERPVEMERGRFCSARSLYAWTVGFTLAGVKTSSATYCPLEWLIKYTQDQPRHFDYACFFVGIHVILVWKVVRHFSYKRVRSCVNLYPYLH